MGGLGFHKPMVGEPLIVYVFDLWRVVVAAQRLNDFMKASIGSVLTQRRNSFLLWFFLSINLF
jgi:hypothetical protein